MKGSNLFILIIFFISCKYKTKTEKSEISKYKVIKEIPKNKKGDLDLFYETNRDLANKLKLDSIENGYDSLQIRIWYNYPFGEKKKVFILKNINSHWSAVIYNLKIKDSDSSYKLENIVSYYCDNKIPKSGWGDFTSKLFALDVLFLPDSKSIKNYDEIFADGTTYNFEISTTKIYRFYSYTSPELIVTKYAEVKKISDILNLINFEFP